MKKIVKKILAMSAVIVLILQYNFALGFSKTETVFTNLDENGNIKKVTVNNHLKLNDNDKGSEIEDNSELQNIININGEETYTIEGNLLQWQSLSKDIYYQGTANKTLPISIEIKYYLDGEEKTIDEIEGKSGNITLEIKLKNNVENKVKINKKEKTLYTPFVVMIGTILSNEENTEITVTNGKTADTGTKTLIAAVASPGLYESLDIEEFKELDTVKISYKTTKFNKTTTMYMAATPKLIEETDLEIFDKMEDLSKDLNTLQENMDVIENGAKELEKGTKNLQEGTKTLKTGAIQVNEGANSLKTGANSVLDGATSVSEGVNTLSKNIDKVVKSVATLETGGKSLNNGLKEILSSIEEAEKLLNSEKANKLFSDIKTLKSKNQTTAQTIKTNYEKYQLSKLSINDIMNSQYDNETKANLITVKNNYESGIVKLLETNTTAVDNVLGNLDTITDKLIALKKALQSAEQGSSQISNGITTLKSGISKIYDGSVTLNDGANKLATGASSLSKGASDLSNGTSELSKGANNLTEGASTLYNGVNTLSDGISTFNKQGIKKLSSYSDKISEYSEIVKELVSLSEKYSGFSCNNANVTNFVFVCRCH